MRGLGFCFGIEELRGEGKAWVWVGPGEQNVDSASIKFKLRLA